MIKLLKIDFRITDLLCLSGFIEIIPGVFGFFLGLTENYQPFLRNSGKYRPFLTTGRILRLKQIFFNIFIQKRICTYPHKVYLY